MASFPVLEQLLLMKRSPFDNQRMSAARQCSVDGIERRDVVLRLVLAVEGMKMWWGMIIPIHTNEDAEEFADGGHVGVLGLIKAIFRLRSELPLQKPRNRCPVHPK